MPKHHAPYINILEYLRRCATRAHLYKDKFIVFPLPRRCSHRSKTCTHPTFPLGTSIFCEEDGTKNIKMPSTWQLIAETHGCLHLCSGRLADVLDDFLHRHDDLACDRIGRLLRVDVCTDGLWFHKRKCVTVKMNIAWDLTKCVYAREKTTSAEILQKVRFRHHNHKHQLVSVSWDVFSHDACATVQFFVKY